MTNSINLHNLSRDMIIEVCKHLGVIDINYLYRTCSVFKKHIGDESQYIYNKCRHIQPHGTIRSWWNSEKTIPKSKAIYIEGKQQGEYKLWYNNGQLSDLCFYRDGKLHGDWKCWHQNGQISDHYIYRNDRPNGEWKSWYDNGQISEIFVYINGKKEGEYKYWHQNGQISEHCFYHFGKLHGEVRHWYLHGQISENSMYLDGKDVWNKLSMG